MGSHPLKYADSNILNYLMVRELNGCLKCMWSTSNILKYYAKYSYTREYGEEATGSPLYLQFDFLQTRAYFRNALPSHAATYWWENWELEYWWWNWVNAQMPMMEAFISKIVHNAASENAVNNTSLWDCSTGANEESWYMCVNAYKTVVYLCNLIILSHRAWLFCDCRMVTHNNTVHISTG